MPDLVAKMNEAIFLFYSVVVLLSISLQRYVAAEVGFEVADLDIVLA